MFVLSDGCRMLGAYVRGGGGGGVRMAEQFDILVPFHVHVTHIRIAVSACIGSYVGGRSVVFYLCV